MRLLDLFCCQGGAAVGYRQAGFEVVGVDHHPQVRYPFEFIQQDALWVLDMLIQGKKAGGYRLRDFDAIHASPPCQAFTKLAGLKKVRKNHPKLIEPTRQLLRESGKPYVIENVAGAPLHSPIILCGVMFGLKVYRHRLFESNVFLMQMPHPKHPEVMPAVGSGVSPGGYVSIGAGGIRGVKNAHQLRSRAMDIDWMNRAGLTEAVPPAYTEFIGKQLIQAIANIESGEGGS